ncbi:MAG TPA: AAA family ATPase [Stellaceae bacterium]|nr:AAA family ATPase [Stellaceae bacterium]
MTPAELATALGGARRDGGSWRALCPAHDDHDPSLGITEKDGKLLLRCRRGCNQGAVIAALRARGLWPDTSTRTGSTRITATYAYRDQSGALRYQVVRLDPKSFRQRRPNGAPDAWVWDMDGVEPLPYRLPELLEDPAATAFIAEGEKDCDALGDRGLVATTNHGGAGKWRPEISRWLTGRHVVILPDNDSAGREHAQDVARKLTGIAASVRIIELPDLPQKGDVTDWLAAGGTADELERLAAAAPIFKPASTFNLMSAADLCARQFTEPKWAVPQIIAEGLTILAGKPKTGKSWLALDFAVAVAGGYAAIGNVECQQGPVLLLALEDNDRRLHQRLRAVLQGHPAPRDLHIATQWRRADAGGLDDLREWLAANPTARLVVIDTLQIVRAARSKSEGVYADDYKAVGELKALADRASVPFVVVHHLRKEAAGDPLESVSGTAGITGSADTILILKREPKDALGLLYVRGRDVPEAEIAMQFDEATGKWLRLAGADDFRRSKERRAILRALIELGEPMTPAEIAAELGKPRNSSGLRMLLYRMHKAGDILRTKDGRYQADSTL